MATQITTHQADALDRLPDRNKDKPTLAALINACTSEKQNIENALWQLVSERSLTVAVGEQLDVIGRVLNQDRATTANDTEYRELLRARILVNKSSGSVPDLLRVLQLLASDSTIELQQNFPASFTVFLNGVEISDATSELIASLIAQARAAGVGAQIVSPPQGSDETFLTARTTLTTASFTAASQSRVFVESTKDFPASGYLLFEIHTGDYLAVSYASKTDTTFEGVATVTGDTSLKTSGSMVYAPTICTTCPDEVFSADTMIELADASEFPTSGHILVGNQSGARYYIFSYTGKTGNQLTGLTDLGFEATTSVDANSIVAFCGHCFSDDVPTATLGGNLSRANEA